MARTAIFVTFALNGLIIGSWTSRIPAVSRQVHAGPGAIGLALLGSSIGLILVAPLTGRLCARFGARLIVVVSGLGAALVLPLIGLAPSVAVLGGVMFGVGVFVGALDVSMNIAAVSVIRQLDRPLMPTFHAAYSFGALAGALVAGWLVALGWSPLRHFIAMAALGVVLVLAVARSVPGTRPDRQARTRPVVGGFGSPIRRPALWLLAAIMLGSAIAEGANGDWSALFLVRQRGIGESSATIGFACFSIAMAVARLLGERWERRWGPYRLLGVCAGVAAIGMFTVVLVPWVPVDYAGFALAGIGLAFCFPVAINLAGAAGRRADGSGGEREIGFVTTIAYTGFLAGPPCIGAIAQATNLSVGLAVVGLIITVIVPMVVLSRLAAAREAPAPVQLTSAG
jgi:MFS family permease